MQEAVQLTTSEGHLLNSGHQPWDTNEDVRSYTPKPFVPRDTDTGDVIVDPKGVPEAIRQAYSTVVTVSEKNEVQAFKITVTDDPHFTTIKGDKRSRIRDTAITAEALLPEGPYDLWKTGDTSRRVKDLSGAFAQLPHLPKMLKGEAIVETLVDGCIQAAFVLRLTRPDGSFRTWWRCRPDEAALEDPH